MTFVFGVYLGRKVWEVVLGKSTQMTANSPSLESNFRGVGLAAEAQEEVK